MTEWIDLEKQKPEHGQPVIIKQVYPENSRFQADMRPLKYLNMYICEYDLFSNSFTDFYRETKKHVKYWMPLPKPPKGEK